MKKNRIICIVIMICGLIGCKTSKLPNTLLCESQNDCLKYNQTCLAKIFKSYQTARCGYNINQAIDSIVASISAEKERDTIFIIETCNPPVYDYFALIWNKDQVFTVYSGGPIIINNDHSGNNFKLMRLIEKWDKEEIMTKNHKQPLKYEGDWVQSKIASRIIMSQAKCESSESIFFTDIDWESKDIPYLIH